MITQEQKNQVAYNDNAVKNYEINRIIKSIYEKKEQEAIKIRREELNKRIRQERNTILLHDRTEVKIDDLTDEMIEKQVEWWFDNYK